MTDELHTRLRILGSPSLQGPDGRPLRSVLSQPKRLAVVSFLACTESGRFVRRDRLIATFWPNSDEKHARASLSEALSRLRSSLGPRAIETRGSMEVALNPDVVWCDVREFKMAVSEHRLKDAADLYRGPLLDGFILDRSPAFDSWLDMARAHIHRAALSVFGQLADEGLQIGDPLARGMAERAVQMAPLDIESCSRLMRILAGEGHHAAAIRAYDMLVEGLNRELEMQPPRELVALAERIRSGSYPSPGREKSGAGPADVPTDTTSAPHEPNPVPPQVQDMPGVPDAEAISEPAPFPHEPPPPDKPPPVRAPPPRGGASQPTQLANWWPAILGLMGLVLAGLIWSPFKSDSSFYPEITFSFPLDSVEHIYLGGLHDVQNGRPENTSVAFSPLGDIIVYVARDAETSRLYVRRLSRPAILRIPGTDGASNPFFSPDGRWIGYFAGEALMRVSTSDFRVETILADAGLSGAWDERSPTSGGASWGDDGSIVYTSGPGVKYLGDIDSEPRLIVESGGTTDYFPRYYQPHVLPGGRHVLLHVQPSMEPEDAYIAALDVESGSLTRILDAAMDPSYVAPEGLFFLREGVLMSVGFDPETLEVSGAPRTELPGVMHMVFSSNWGYETGAGQYDVSRQGHLVYASGGIAQSRLRIPVRVTPDGRSESVGLPPDQYGMFRYSPSGQTILFQTQRGVTSRRVWEWDTERQARRLVAEQAANPFWGPEEGWVTFQSTAAGPQLLFTMPVDGSRPASPVLPDMRGVSGLSWSPSGELAFRHDEDIWIRWADGTTSPLVASDFDDGDASFSPDGRWMAFSSRRSGRRDVYVRAFPGPGRELIISAEDAINPVWGADGRTIYYLRQSNRDTRRNTMMAVDVRVVDGSLVAGPPRELFAYPNGGRVPTRHYDVHPDGSFIMAVLVDSTTAPADTVMFEVPPFARPLSTFQRNGATELHVIWNFSPPSEPTSGED